MPHFVRLLMISLITMSFTLHCANTRRIAVVGAELILGAPMPDDVNGDSVLQLAIDIIEGGRFDLYRDSILPYRKEGEELKEAQQRWDDFRFELRHRLIQAGCLTGPESEVQAHAIQELIFEIVPEVQALTKEWIEENDKEYLGLALDLGMPLVANEIEKCLKKIPSLHSSPELVVELARLTKRDFPERWGSKIGKDLPCA